MLGTVKGLGVIALLDNLKYGWNIKESFDKRGMMLLITVGIEVLSCPPLVAVLADETAKGQHGRHLLRIKKTNISFHPCVVCFV